MRVHCKKLISKKFEIYVIHYIKVYSYVSIILRYKTYISLLHLYIIYK